MFVSRFVAGHPLAAEIFELNIVDAGKVRTPTVRASEDRIVE